MKVFFYVEGPSDAAALMALLREWQGRLQAKGIGLRAIHVGNKTKLLRQIGVRAAEKLVASEEDLVVAWPDLHPADSSGDSRWRHGTLRELKDLMLRETAASLGGVFGVRDSAPCLRRFYPSALKHDLEMLLLAAKAHLRTMLGTSDNLGKWRRPLEDQDFERPPKRIVEELFVRYKKREYRETADAQAVLTKVSGMAAEVIRDEQNQVQCPEFKRVLDWLGEATGVPVY